MTNKEYVAQLESTIQNLRRDISVLKEKLSLYDELEKENCSLEIIARANKNGIWVQDERKGFYHIRPEDLNISLRDSMFVLQELYFEDLDYVMDTTGSQFYGDEYMYDWWLKEDRSE